MTALRAVAQHTPVLVAVGPYLPDKLGRLIGLTR